MAHSGDTDLHSDNNNDENDGDTTRTFQPDHNSTPGPSREQLEMTTLNRELREEGAKMAETSFMEGIDLKTLKKSIEITHGKDELRNQLPDVKESGIHVSFNEDEGVVMAKHVGQREELVRIIKRKEEVYLQVSLRDSNQSLAQSAKC